MPLTPALICRTKALEKWSGLWGYKWRKSWPPQCLAFWSLLAAVFSNFVKTVKCYLLSTLKLTEPLGISTLQCFVCKARWLFSSSLISAIYLTSSNRLPALFNSEGHDPLILLTPNKNSHKLSFLGYPSYLLPFYRLIYVSWPHFA